jgi:Predicted phosphohydrolases
MRINLSQKLTGLLLFLCLTIQIKADKTIYLLADTHVMSPSLLDSSDNTAWQEYLAEHRNMQDLSVPIYNQLIEQIITDHPDALLICGDLTKDGETASHEYVLERLRKVEAAGIPVFVIPR